MENCKLQKKFNDKDKKETIKLIEKFAKNQKKHIYMKTNMIKIINLLTIRNPIKFE